MWTWEESIYRAVLGSSGLFLAKLTLYPYGLEYDTLHSYILRCVDNGCTVATSMMPQSSQKIVSLNKANELYYIRKILLS